MSLKETIEQYLVRTCGQTCNNGSESGSVKASQDLIDLFKERIGEVLQRLWKTDPRSQKGKKQENTEAWIMGYRTAQKEIAIEFRKVLER